MRVRLNGTGLGKNASVLIVAIARRYFEYNEKPARTNQFDAGAASENLALEETFRGRAGPHSSFIKKTGFEFAISGHRFYAIWDTGNTAYPGVMINCAASIDG